VFVVAEHFRDAADEAPLISIPLPSTRWAATGAGLTPWSVRPDLKAGSKVDHLYDFGI